MFTAGSSKVPGLVGTRTMSSASAPSNSLPLGWVRLGFGWTTWKSPGTSRAGSPWTSGQLPEPDNSMVQVTGSPTLTWTGTTFEATLKSPTAPVNPSGAGGRGRTSIVGGAPVTANCW